MNIFESAMGNLSDLQQSLLGPDYKYHQKIKTPSELGVTDEGGLDHLADNIAGLIGYVELLVAGTGEATTTGNPLGNKFFLKTAGKCKVKSNGSDNGKIVKRYSYINNVPDGNIPFISSSLGGVEFKSFKGLIPGTLSSAAGLNPFGILQAFQLGSTPECQSITLETIDSEDKVSSSTNYVATVDLKNMPPNWFPNKVNPVTGMRGREAFGQRKKCNNEKGKIPRSSLATMYHITISLLCLSILYGLLKKMK
jgi:hypothetical protein